MPKVIKAEESPDGYVTATVEFPDGLAQTVRIHKALANKSNLKAMAKVLRDEAEAVEAGKTKRDDLVE